MYETNYKVELIFKGLKKGLILIFIYQMKELNNFKGIWSVTKCNMLCCVENHIFYENMRFGNVFFLNQ